MRRLLLSIVLSMMMFCVAGCTSSNHDARVFNALKKQGIILVGDTSFSDYVSHEPGGIVDGEEYTYEYKDTTYCVILFKSGKVRVVTTSPSHTRMEDFSYVSGKVTTEELIYDNLFFDSSTSPYGLYKIRYDQINKDDTDIIVSFDASVDSPIASYLESSPDYASSFRDDTSYSVREADVVVLVGADSSSPIECKLNMITHSRMARLSDDSIDTYDVKFTYPGKLDSIDSITIGDITIDNLGDN